MTNQTASKDGRIMLNLPQGNYEIEIWYQGTKAQMWGKRVSLTSILAITLLVVNSKLFGNNGKER
ncbi:MAG: hypothetical protein QNJ32_25250 [Xenococcaceae cyanobacterium MO_167.B27]|nr:hypothetical protein [Xenococcaceae cyanobacterium MO_167.B27]